MRGSRVHLQNDRNSNAFKLTDVSYCTEKHFQRFQINLLWVIAKKILYVKLYDLNPSSTS